MATPRDVMQALSARAKFECLSHAELGSKQLRLVGRVQAENSKVWLKFVEDLLDRMPTEPWTLDVSKSYFKENGPLRFCWRLLFQGDNVANHYPAIISVISSVSSFAQTEVMEQPLVGSSPLRMGTQNGKGASSVGTAPLIAQRGR